MKKFSTVVSSFKLTVRRYTFVIVNYYIFTIYVSQPEMEWDIVFGENPVSVSVGIGAVNSR